MARDGALGNLEIGRTPQVRYLKPRPREPLEQRGCDRDRKGLIGPLLVQMLEPVRVAHAEPAANACGARSLCSCREQEPDAPVNRKDARPVFDADQCVGVAGLEQKPPERSGTVVARQAVRHDETKASARTA